MPAVHSVLERGTDRDVLELKELVKKDKDLAMLVYESCRHSDVYALPQLFMLMIEDLYSLPENNASPDP